MSYIPLRAVFRHSTARLLFIFGIVLGVFAGWHVGGGRGASGLVPIEIGFGLVSVMVAIFIAHRAEHRR